jgi:hypothetical protein
MPRPKDPLQSIVKPLAEQFATSISGAVMSFVHQRVREEVAALVGRAVRVVSPTTITRKPGRRRAAGHQIRSCRVPGCARPSKGPRYDFFCEVHRDLPAAEKAAIKASKPTSRGAVASKAGGRKRKQQRATAKKSRALTTAKVTGRKKAVAARRTPPVMCAKAGCAKGWYRPSGRDHKLCYQHYLESGGTPPRGK